MASVLRSKRVWGSSAQDTMFGEGCTVKRSIITYFILKYTEFSRKHSVPVKSNPQHVQKYKLVKLLMVELQ